MTKHRTPEERVQEILDAAAQAIEEEGYARLTMERIIARTGLSKGGVYRFFGNKREVALKLLERVYSRWTRIDVDEALGWDLPPVETLVRVMVPSYSDDAEEARVHRLWAEILPDVVRDPEFASIRTRAGDETRCKYEAITRALLERDGLQKDDELEAAMRVITGVGSVFVRGLVLALLSNESREQLEAYARDFSDMLMQRAKSEATSGSAAA